VRTAHIDAGEGQDSN